MNKLLILTIIIMIFVIILLLKGKEHFEYDDDYINSIDPGFGHQLGNLETAPQWDPSMMDELSKHWTDGMYGQLVSYLEDRKDAPAIRNI